MNKVQIFCYDRNISVDEDQVTFHLKRDLLVKETVKLQTSIAVEGLDPVAKTSMESLLHKNMRQTDFFEKEN